MLYSYQTMKRPLLFILPLLFLALAPADRVVSGSDLAVLSDLRQEEAHSSDVAKLLVQLTDVNGPRLTGSPGFDRAAEWVRDTLSGWGLANVRFEDWGEFGKGWEPLNCRVEIIEPYDFPLIAYPKAWTAGLAEPVEGAPIVVRINDEEDIAEYRGKLGGAIVLWPRDSEVAPRFEPDAGRYSDAQLEELCSARMLSAAEMRARHQRYRLRREFARKVQAFLRDEGVRVLVEESEGDDGTVFVTSGGSERMDAPLGLPAVVVASEQFGRMRRILEAGSPLKIRVELESRALDAQSRGYNVLAEIPGNDPSLTTEIVMLGAHLDSWHAGTGATDDAAGCVAVLEAVRLLRELDIPLRRTLRVALWSGEEQGLLGSRAYVKNHFADAETARKLEDYERLSAYFNLDNGSGKIRGIYLQGNDAVRPIFEDFIAPIRDLGVTAVTIRNTGGTDHIPFDAVGLPGFQFIQDPLDYETRTHHSNMDVYEHVSIPDLRQAAVVMAWFAYRTAQLDERLPRERWPRKRGDDSGEGGD